MKHFQSFLRLSFLVLYLVTSVPVLAQWEWQLPKTKSSSISDIQFLNNQVGYTTSSSQNFLKTTDGGLNWIPKPIGVNKKFYGLYFVTTEIGWVTSEDSVICKTTNGGDSWIVQNVPNLNGHGVLDIHFINPQVGWVTAFNGYLARTTNGGSTWQYVDIGTNGYRGSIEFYDDQHGRISGRFDSNYKYFVSVTSDGGVTWNPQTLPSSIFYLSASNFINAQTGWIVGSSQSSSNQRILMKTSNGGQSWQTLNLVNPKFVMFSDSVNGFAETESGFFLSTDGGEQWINSPVPNSNSAYINSTCFLNTNIWLGGSNGYILNSTDAGVTWNYQVKDYSALRAIHFSDAKHGWATGENILLKTLNGGKDWIELQPPSPVWFNSVFFIDSLKGFMSGMYGSLFRTINGGVNWTQMNSNSSDFLTNIVFTTPMQGFAVGYNSDIVRTTNGGLTWSKQSVFPLNYSGADVSFTDQQNGYILKEKLWKTTNGGQSWEIVSPMQVPFGGMICIHFLSPLVGFCGGSDGTVSKTTDGGHTWTSMNLFIPVQDTRDIFFVDEYRGVVIGNSLFTGPGGVFWYTIDGGNTWFQVPETENIFGASGKSIQIINGTEAWILGAKGEIFHNTNLFAFTAAKSIVSSKEYSLYPNPAQTTFHLKTEGIVREVRIVDSMGKLLLTLQNLATEIDVSGIPKGIYSVIITTSDGTKSQRLVKE